MLKNKKYIFSLFFILCDALGIYSAVYLTYFLRILLNPLFTLKFSMENVNNFFIEPYFIIIIWVFISNQKGSYDLNNIGSFKDWMNMLKSNFITLTFLIILSFMLKREELSRSLIILFFVFNIIFVNLFRFIGIKILSWFKERGVLSEKVAIIGENEQTVSIANFLRKKRYLGAIFSGYITLGEKKENISPDLENDLILGSIDDIQNLVRKHNINRIIFVDKSLPEKKLFSLIELCEKLDVRFEILPDFYNFAGREINLNEIEGIPLIQLRGFRLTEGDLLIKRILETLTCLILFILLFPFFVFITLLIKLESKGPAIFRQKRFGKKGKIFEIYKFRSMYEDASARRVEIEDYSEKGGFIFKIKDDPRITKVGRFIRRYSIDELPQLVNVIKGEMCLVGSRPLPVEDLIDVERSEFKSWFYNRSHLPPGLTGLWQVSGRSNTDFEDMVKYDLYYIQNWSLWLDIKIILKTMFVVIKGVGAY